MPLPSFNLDVSINYLSGLAEEKQKILENAIIHKVDVLNAQLVKTLQEAYSGGVVQNRTGNAARSVELIPAVSDGSTVRGAVTAGGGTAPYVIYLEEGTAPHDIVASKSKALAFVLGGSPVFFKKVHHPGTKAYRIVEDAFVAWEPQMEDALQAVPREVFP